MAHCCGKQNALDQICSAEGLHDCIDNVAMNFFGNAGFLVS